MFDVFIADLRCPGCGAVTADAEMQTYIRGMDAYSTSLRVGFELEARRLETAALVGQGYEVISEPAPGEAVRLLDVWICWKCHTEQWGLVTIEGARITAIEAVRLTRHVLEGANFISDTNAELLAGTFPHEPGLSSVEVLRRNLPAA